MIDGIDAEMLRGALEVAQRRLNGAVQSLSDVEMLSEVEAAQRMLDVARNKLLAGIETDALGNWKRQPVGRGAPRGRASR